MHIGGALVAAHYIFQFRDRASWSASRRRAFTIFIVSALVLLTASGVYHSSAANTWSRAMLRRIDHAAIFVFIAGSFTPLVWHFVEKKRVALLAFLWTLALTGVFFKTLFFDDISFAFGVGLYLILGWSGGAICAYAARRAGKRTLAYLLAGGIAYSTGAIIEVLQMPYVVFGFGHHEFLHLFVLIGLALHGSYLYRVAACPRGIDGQCQLGTEVSAAS